MRLLLARREARKGTPVKSGQPEHPLVLDEAFNFHLIVVGDHAITWAEVGQFAVRYVCIGS